MKELNKEQLHALHECYMLLLKQKVEQDNDAKAINKDHQTSPTHQATDIGADSQEMQPKTVITEAVLERA